MNDSLRALLLGGVALGALAGGKLFGRVALDAAMGLVGAVVIAHWPVGLLRRSGRVLLDARIRARWSTACAASWKPARTPTSSICTSGAWA